MKSRDNLLDARGCGELDHLLSKAQWVRTYPAGRVCAHDGCGTTLSIYNPDRHCAAHKPEPDLLYIGRRFFVCSDCGEVREWRHRVPGRPLCRNCRRKLDAAEAAPPPVKKPNAVQKAQAKIPRRAVIVTPHMTYETELK